MNDMKTTVDAMAAPRMAAAEEAERRLAESLRVSVKEIIRHH